MTDFKPNWVSPPCNTIHDVLKMKRITPYELRLRLRLTMDEAHGLLTSKLPITKNIARGLASVLGSTPKFWIRREEHYAKECIRLNVKR